MCLASFQDVYSLLNPGFATRNFNGYMFETWTTKISYLHRKRPQRRDQGKGRHNASGNRLSRPHNHCAGAMSVLSGALPAAQTWAPPSAPASTPSVASFMRYEPTYSGNGNPKARNIAKCKTVRVQCSDIRVTLTVQQDGCLLSLDSAKQGSLTETNRRPSLLPSISDSDI